MTQPNEGEWGELTEQEEALWDTLPAEAIVGPPQPDGEKVRVWVWMPEKRYSASGETRTACLRKLANRLAPSG